MSLSTFAFAMVRVVLAVVAAGVAGHWSARALGYGADGVGRLAAVVMGVSVVLVCAEVLGVVGELRAVPLIAVLIVVAAGAWTWAARGRVRDSSAADRAKKSPVTAPPADRGLQGEARPAVARRLRLARIWTLVAVSVIGGQWALATADSYGGGMFNFDTLWYHMPFAAGYALSGSITAIHFTQADPWVAYYPANSELVHAVGIVLLHGDVLSPLVNVGWLAVLLLGAWCVGRPWQVEAETLVAGCLVAGLPVLASTQPGEAFNDIAGLAMLVAAAALLFNSHAGMSAIPVGLALGWAAGTKFTFLVPVLVVLLGVALHARSSRAHRRAPSAEARRPRLGRPATMTLAAVVAGGWWYLHNLMLVGNPLGARLQVGPVVLPGPRSPLAASSQQTVLSQLRHVSLWGSRFIPGLTHAFGALWPVLLVGGVVVLAIAITRRHPLLCVCSPWPLRRPELPTSCCPPVLRA